MKKTMLLTMLAITVVMFGAAQAHAALPVINGGLGGTEWDNAGYQYYLTMTDPNEAGVPDQYDIKRAIVLQDLADADANKHGIYFMLETWATPPSLIDQDHVSTRSSLALFADFGGDGFPTGAYGPFPPDVQIYITNINNISMPGPVYTDPFVNDLVYWCSGAAASCDAANGTLIWQNGAPNANTPAGFEYARGADVVEMFLRTGTFGTPANVAFPFTFTGTATYDDGTIANDDIVKGQLPVIPEPASMFLLGSGLLGLFGFKRFGK